MQKRAPRVFRWTERMHAPDLDLVEHDARGEGFVDLDSLAETLGPLFDQIAAEIVPDLRDRLIFLKEFVAEGEAEPGAPVTAKPHQRIIGEIETSFRGVSYRGGVQPYTFFLWQRLRDAAGASSEINNLFKKHRLDSLIECDLPIKVERSNNIEVWA